MLWSTLVQSGTPRQAETAIEAKNLAAAALARPAGVSAARSRQSRGTHRTSPARTWSPLIEFSCCISCTITLVSAFGSYASPRDHRLCPGSTVTLVTYLPGDPDPARVACAAV